MLLKTRISSSAITEFMKCKLKSTSPLSHPSRNGLRHNPSSLELISEELTSRSLAGTEGTRINQKMIVTTKGIETAAV
jgi:hypothetical protein